MKSIFKDGDIICFLGDSITANGLVCAEVYQTLGKQARIKCYNCGVSGSRADFAKDYLHSLCLSYNPTHVAIMFGVNDIDRNYYADSYTAPDKEELIRAAMEEHKSAYERIVSDCIKFGATVVLCIPVPFDEISNVPTENLKCQRGLDESAEFVRSLAEKYGCAIVDYDRVFRPMLKDGKVMREDRVHPTEYGYHVMAQTFMRDTGIIKECDFNTPFEFEPWNKERYDAEIELKKIDFIEHCVLHRVARENRFNIAEKKEYAQNLIKTSAHVMALSFYISEVDHRDEHLGRVIEKSIFVKE